MSQSNDTKAGGTDKATVKTGKPTREHLDNIKSTREGIVKDNKIVKK